MFFLQRNNKLYVLNIHNTRNLYFKISLYFIFKLKLIIYVHQKILYHTLLWHIFQLFLKIYFEIKF
jgi:hypothetical protein